MHAYDQCSDANVLYKNLYKIGEYSRLSIVDACTTNHETFLPELCNTVTQRVRTVLYTCLHHSYTGTCATSHTHACLTYIYEDLHMAI